MEKDKIGKNKEFTKDNTNYRDERLEIGMKEKAYFNIYEELNSSDDKDLNTDIIDEWVDVLDDIMKPSKRITEPDVDAFIQQTLNEHDRIKSNANKRYKNKILRSVASLVIIFIIGNVIVSEAFGINVWDYFVEWGEETFSLKTKNYQEENYDHILNDKEAKEYLSFEDLIKDIDVEIMVPKYVPEGYFLQNIKINESPDRIYITGFYLYGKKEYSYYIQILKDKNLELDRKYEKDKNIVEVYKKNNIKYYLMGNIEENQAIWNISNIIYNITGDVSHEEIKLIINSMND